MSFGTMPDGSTVERHRIEGGGLVAHVLTYGAVLQDLRLEGHDAPLVLGFEEFAPYLTDSPYFGATVGRCANRIGEGRFKIDGVPYQVDQNFQDRHHLHGGAGGVGKRCGRSRMRCLSTITCACRMSVWMCAKLGR